MGWGDTPTNLAFILQHSGCGSRIFPQRFPPPPPLLNGSVRLRLSEEPRADPPASVPQLHLEAKWSYWPSLLSPDPLSSPHPTHTLQVRLVSSRVSNIVVILGGAGRGHKQNQRFVIRDRRGRLGLLLSSGLKLMPQFTRE